MYTGIIHTLYHHKNCKKVIDVFRKFTNTTVGRCFRTGVLAFAIPKGKLQLLNFAKTFRWSFLMLSLT